MKTELPDFDFDDNCSICPDCNQEYILEWYGDVTEPEYCPFCGKKEITDEDISKLHDKLKQSVIHVIQSLHKSKKLSRY